MSIELAITGSVENIVVQVEELKQLIKKYGFDDFDESYTTLDSHSGPKQPLFACEHIRVLGNGNAMMFINEAMRLPGVQPTCLECAKAKMLDPESAFHFFTRFQANVASAISEDHVSLEEFDPKWNMSADAPDN